MTRAHSFDDTVNMYSHALSLLPTLSLSLTSRGAAIALSTVNILSPLLLIVYIKWRGLHRVTWGGWSWEALHDWGQYLKLGIPGDLSQNLYTGFFLLKGTFKLVHVHGHPCFFFTQGNLYNMGSP